MICLILLNCLSTKWSIYCSSSNAAGLTWAIIIRRVYCNYLPSIYTNCYFLSEFVVSRVHNNSAVCVVFLFGHLCLGLFIVLDMFNCFLTISRDLSPDLKRHKNVFVSNHDGRKLQWSLKWTQHPAWSTRFLTCYELKRMVSFLPLTWAWL